MFAAISGKGSSVYHEEEKAHKKPGALQNEKLQSSRALLTFVLIAAAAVGVAAVLGKNKKG